MTLDVFCLNCSNGICPFKKEYLSFHKHIKCSHKCTLKDKKDYKSFNSNYWFPEKIKLFYTSTCPMVSVNWWRNGK